MILGVYSMQDRFTGFMQPTFELNDAVALRNFEHAVLNTDSLLYSHSSDYRLMKIGQFDSETGLLEPVSPAQVIADGGSIHLKVLSQQKGGDSR